MKKINFDFPVFLSPYKKVSYVEKFNNDINSRLEFDVSEKFYDFVYSNRDDDKTTMQEIKESFEKLRTEIEKIESRN